MVKEILAKRWEVGAEHYSKGSKGFNEDNWCQIINTIVPISGQQSKALDVGTGPGVMAFVLAKLGYEVTGLDLSYSMLDIAKEAGKDKGVLCSFVQGDAEELSFQNESFDLVTNRLNLWTLPNPGKGVYHWSRVLKPGGNLMVIVNDIRHPLDISGQVPKETGHNKHIFSKEYYDSFTNLPFAIAVPSQVKALLEAAGLKDVRIEKIEDKIIYKEDELLDYLRSNQVEEDKLLGLVDENGDVKHEQLQQILDDYGLTKLQIQKNNNTTELVALKLMAAVVGTKK